MMLRRVELRGVVTASAKRIAFCAQRERVRIMTVGAGDAVPEHLALQKRAPDVILVALLTIRVINGCREPCQSMRVLERRARLSILRDRRAARMARSANIQRGGISRSIAVRVLRVGRREFPCVAPARPHGEREASIVLRRVGRL